MKKMVKLISVVLALCMFAALFTGCNGDKKDTSEGTSKEASSTAATSNTEASEQKYAPSKEISPKAWFTWADTFAPAKRPAEDVVGAEIQGLTKVKFTLDNIIANNGVTGPERLNMFIATNELPEIIYAQVSSSTDIINKLVESQKVWELSAYLEKYCPNVMKRLLKETWDCWKKDGKIYGIPSDFTANLTYEPAMTDLAKEQIADKPGPWQMVVRDDLLKQIYPETKSVAELKTALDANGQLTWDDLKTPINTPEDLLDFLRKVKALNVKTQGKDVIPLDMWTNGWWVAPFGEAWGFMNPGAWGVTWSDEANSVYWAPSTPEYREYLYWLHTAYKEKLMDQETFVMSDDQRNTKMNSGLYAVSHNWQDINSVNTNVEKNNDKFAYRLMRGLTRKINGDPQYTLLDPRGGNLLMISKAVPEENMIQILNWIDFMYSYEGEELMAWGPESAGLWEMKDGVKIFKDQSLMQNAMYGVETEKDLTYYGLSGGPVNFYELGRFTYLHTNTRKVQAYHKVPAKVDNIYGAQYASFWSQMFPKEQRTNPIFKFLGQVPEISKLTSEEGLYGAVKNEWAKAIVAKNDAEFDKYYQDGLKRLKDLGMEKSMTDLTKLVNDFKASSGK
jgi:putative aldouronate transport system substrate-binding protein